MNFASICVWTELVTPDKYPNSVLVTEDETIFPLEFETTALFPSRFVVVIVLIAPDKHDFTKEVFAAFCELTPEQFIKIFSQTSSNKIKEIIVTCQEFEEDIDLSPIFKNLPKLTKFRADCHCSMDYLFGVQPVISCEKVAPSYPIIEQLITNYYIYLITIQHETQNAFKLLMSISRINLK